MNDKLTPKQEAFARYIAEGLTYAESYKRAYNAENMSDNAVRVEASRLVASPNISLMVMELQEVANERSITNIIGQTVRLKELSAIAETGEQYSASISAEKEINKLNGLYIEDNKQKADATTVSMSSVDLARRVAFLLRKGQEEMNG